MRKRCYLRFFASHPEPNHISKAFTGCRRIRYSINGPEWDLGEDLLLGGRGGTKTNILV